jgi:predicted Fe-S protein YdhL (DUF1289 family)
MQAKFINRIEVRVQSPGLENCCLNVEKICLGSFRSIVEISQWSQMNDRKRLDVLHKAENRREAHDINNSK